MRLPLLTVALLALAGCDASAGDLLESEYVSVYAFTARSDGAVGAVTSGRIGLERVPSDVSGVPDLWRGVYDLDAASGAGLDLDGTGSLRGADGAPVVLDVFLDVPPPGLGPPEDETAYRLVGAFSDDGSRFLGVWELRDAAGSVAASGPFEAARTRAATRFYIAG